MLSSRILVVEDESIVAHNLRQQLTKLGYEVSAVVRSGAQALQKIETLQPDVVLMDINIEGDLDGIETAARIAPELQLPVIYLTAYMDEAVLDRARTTRPYGYLVKPFSVPSLHATIQMVLERRHTDIELRASEQRLRLAMEAAEIGFWELDAPSRRFFCVGLADRLFGFGNDLFAGTWDAFLARVHPDERQAVAEQFNRALQEQGLCRVEFRSVRESGERWLRIQGRVFAQRHGEGPHRVIGIVQDIHERRQTEQRLREAATVFESTQDCILTLDQELHMVSANQSYCDVTGFALDEVIGRRYPPLAADGLPEQQLKEMFNALQSNGVWRGEIFGQRKNGERFPTLTNIAAVRDARGLLTHYVVVFTDLTAVHSARQQLYFLANHDALTSLPNRLLARDRLDRALERARRWHKRVGVLIIDIDYFKRVNDILGHQLGDDLLRGAAHRIQHCVRSEDTVARLGGDEFMVICDHLVRVEDVAMIAEKIIGALARQFELETTISVSASAGISLFPDDGDSSAELIRTADTAMYAAKALGRQRYAFYTAEMTAAARRYLELDQELRRGLEQGEFLLHYQPQINMVRGAVVGVEALIRWQHPQKGLLGAGDIIPVAEESGLIIGIGEWVVAQACRQARLWREGGLPPLRIAINVSIRQMQRERLIEAIRRALADNAVPSSQLEIEVTESTLQSEAACVATLNALNELGVSLAVDDFGTGYSCLSSLKNLPIHRVKIDRAFVRDIPHDGDDVAITEAIIAMAHRLKLQVVAEGVETAEQEQLLRASGCDEAQGYLYAKPMAPEAVAGYLRSAKWQAT